MIKNYDFLAVMRYRPCKPPWPDVVQEVNGFISLVIESTCCHALALVMLAMTYHLVQHNICSHCEKPWVFPGCQAPWGST